MLFFLILTFWAYTGNSYQLSVTDPALAYHTVEECDAAGAAAKASYNGGAKIEWTCVPNRPLIGQ